MSNQEKQYLRFSLFRRYQHWINTVSFLTLGFTGLIQMFNQAPISLFFLERLGGVEVVRIIHRVSAIVLVLVAIVHVGDAVYSWYVNRKPLSMLPGKEDITNAWGLLLYNLGIRKEKPKQGFYTFEEKFEYWALIWGTVLMGITGFILWNPLLANKVLPGAWIPAAKAAHGLEAVLAVLAILIWHMYHVFIKHFNKSMYTGYMSHEEMEHHHPKTLEEPEYIPPAKDDPKYQKRRTAFFRVYGVVAIGMLAGLVWLVTAEDTAIETIPPVDDLRDLVAYAPLPATPIPTFLPGDAADLGATWHEGIGTFINERCALCHKAEGGLGELNLTTYEAALEGGISGPAIKPGASGVSPLVIWPQRADHPVLLESNQIAALRLWIDMGAPIGVPQPTPTATITPTPAPTPTPGPTEEGGETGEGGEGGVEAVTYVNSLQELFTTMCGACHGTFGGLDVTNYESLVSGGVSGTGIVPGDPDSSVVYLRQAAGENHAGQFNQEQIDLLREWILAGAPEQ